MTNWLDCNWLCLQSIWRLELWLAFTDGCLRGGLVRLLLVRFHEIWCLLVRQLLLALGHSGGWWRRLFNTWIDLLTFRVRIHEKFSRICDRWIQWVQWIVYKLNASDAKAWVLCANRRLVCGNKRNSKLLTREVLANRPIGLAQSNQNKPYTVQRDLICWAPKCVKLSSEWSGSVFMSRGWRAA